jgi:hypothetical protein
LVLGLVPTADWSSTQEIAVGGNERPIFFVKKSRERLRRFLGGRVSASRGSRKFILEFRNYLSSQDFGNGFVPDEANSMRMETYGGAGPVRP